MADIFSLPPLAGQGDTLQKAQNLFGVSPEDLAQLKAIKDAGVSLGDLSDFRLNQTALGLLQSSLDPERKQKDLEMYGDYYRKLGQEAQKLGKESLAYTSMMNQINNLPGTIASAFGGTGERELMQNLYGKIPEVVSETYRTFPRMQIQPVAYGMPSSRYFS